jgi:hypothetical protein
VHLSASPQPYQEAVLVWSPGVQAGHKTSVSSSGRACSRLTIAANRVDLHISEVHTPTVEVLSTRNGAFLRELVQHDRDKIYLPKVQQGRDIGMQLYLMCAEGSKSEVEECDCGRPLLKDFILSRYCKTLHDPVSTARLISPLS